MILYKSMLLTKHHAKTLERADMLKDTSQRTDRKLVLLLIKWSMARNKSQP